MNDKKRILWGVSTSRTIRAHWALHELDLDFELRPILPRNGDTQTAEFTALSARQKIPLLQDDDLVLTESAAIVSWDAIISPNTAMRAGDRGAGEICARALAYRYQHQRTSLARRPRSLA